MKPHIVLVFALLLLFPQTVISQPASPSYLRCEYLQSPMCIGTASPRFSWEVRDDRRGGTQSAYELRVATTPELLGGQQSDVWSTGFVTSRDTINVTYTGPALASGHRYFWAVRTWDSAGEPSPWSEPAQFTMGLASSDWKAQWIAHPTQPPPARAARNGFHTQFADNADTEKWVTIDLGQDLSFDNIRIYPARPYDFSPDTPGFGFPVRYRILASTTDSFTDAKALVDRAAEDQTQATEPIILRFPAATARHVRLSVPRLRQATPGRFALALAELQVLSGDQVISTKAVVTASDSIENADWSTKYLTDGDTESHRASGFEALAAPMFRKEFPLAGDVKRAMLHITALGLYEARINGARIGDHQLAPEWTDYHTRVQYQTYDVTSTLRRGDNAIGVQVADGWYAGRLGMAQGFTPDKRPRAVYGRTPRLIAQLTLELADGSTQVISTDSSWLTTTAGPIRSSDLLDGEAYDARNEMTGWDKPGFHSAQDEPLWFPAVVDTSTKTRLDPQPNEPIRATQELKPIAFTQPKPGVYIFDLGQNMPGWCRVTCRGKPGATITLRHAEAINDDGTLYTTNLRGAPQIDRYTLRGEAAGESWEPRFTYHGFRFVEWTGDAEPPTKDSLVGVAIHSDSPVISTFECSSPMLNKLWSNILWTQHANMMSVPTDCPQRDERLGWMGDILAFGQNASFNKDMAAFYAKWLRDVRDAQADDGRFPDVAPHPYGKNERFTGVPAWGDAGVFVPWVSYLNYGDSRMLSEHFDAARRWVDWIQSKNPDLIWRNARHNDYNDWLNGDTLIADGWPRTGAAIPNEVFATAFFARSTFYVAEMARVLGKSDDESKYRELHSGIVSAFNAAFVGKDAEMPGDTQAGYALALAFDLVPPDKRDAAVQQLVQAIVAYRGHLSTGFHSSHHAMIELTKAGQVDIAYRLACNTTFPSWGYSIQNGATTIWERWDGYVKGRGFQDPGMNSLNHWALGSVGEWMMRTIIGINNDPGSPGWAHFELSPRPGGALTHAKGSYRSIRGTIESSWRIEKQRYVYEFTVPANTSALLTLRTAKPESVTESDMPAAQQPGIRLVDAGDTGVFAAELQAGRYRFACEK